MKCLWFGIKDYIKDCRYDRAVREVNKHHFLVEVKDKIRGDWYPLHERKEGSVWHYIRQRKEHFADASKKIKKRK